MNEEKMTKRECFMRWALAQERERLGDIETRLMQETLEFSPIDLPADCTPKPCPFCAGTRVRLFQAGTNTADQPIYAVHCGDCLAAGPADLKADSAIAAWNRRVSVEVER